MGFGVQQISIDEMMRWRRTVIKIMLRLWLWCWLELILISLNWRWLMDEWIPEDDWESGNGGSTDFIDWNWVCGLNRRCSSYTGKKWSFCRANENLSWSRRWENTVFVTRPRLWWREIISKIGFGHSMRWGMYIGVDIPQLQEKSAIREVRCVY